MLLGLERLPVSDTRPLSFGNTTVHSASMTLGVSHLLPCEAFMQRHHCMAHSQVAGAKLLKAAHRVLDGL